jgi:hypothetical protein
LLKSDTAARDYLVDRRLASAEKELAQLQKEYRFNYQLEKDMANVTATCTKMEDRVRNLMDAMDTRFPDLELSYSTGDSIFNEAINDLRGQLSKAESEASDVRIELDLLKRFLSKRLGIQVPKDLLKQEQFYNQYGYELEEFG